MLSNDLNKHDLYEQCVQSPEHLLPMLAAIHGSSPRILGEDFAGTAALSYLWAEADLANRAIAVDLDEETLCRHPSHDRVTRIVGDLRTAAPPDPQAGTPAAQPRDTRFGEPCHLKEPCHLGEPCHPEADILFVGNFSIGYLHTRAELVAYLTRARTRLNPGGVFLCDTYGGESAFLLGEVHRDHLAPDGRRIRYTWEQRDANPITGMVTDVLHFEIDRAGMIEAEFPEAFVYRWRLWSVPELTDALAEAGFAETEVYDKTPDAEDEEGNALMLPVTGDGDVEDSFIVCVAGRV